MVFLPPMRNFRKMRKLMSGRRTAYPKQWSDGGNDETGKASEQMYRFRKPPVHSVNFFRYAELRQSQHLSETNFVFLEIINFHVHVKHKRWNYCLTIQKFLQSQIVSLNCCIYARRFAQKLPERKLNKEMSLEQLLCFKNHFRKVPPQLTYLGSITTKSQVVTAVPHVNAVGSGELSTGLLLELLWMIRVLLETKFFLCYPKRIA